jgi:hypothetical protein
LPFWMPSWIWTVWAAAVGHVQAKSTESGMLMLALDLFCQMPVVSSRLSPYGATKRIRAFGFSSMASAKNAP